MIEFINKLTGASFWVADDRVEEYRAAGHRPAAEPEKPKKAPKKKK